MIPTHIGAPGICHTPVSRYLTDISKQPPVQLPHRHQQAAHAHAHAHETYMRNTRNYLTSSAMKSSSQPFSTCALTPIRDHVSGVTITTPLLPYPSVPIQPFTLGSQFHEIPNLGFYNSTARWHPSTSAQSISKVPLTRNYLELAMLVCNTFRGKLFPCPHCRYVTDRRNNLKRHISTMHQACDKLLECCGVSFSTKASLREHIMIFHHNGYSCPYCGRRFCRKALLKRHLSVHSGQKDYTCPCCDYATSHKSNLERHKRIHERIKHEETGGFLSFQDLHCHPNRKVSDTTGKRCEDIDHSELVESDSDDSCAEIEVADDQFDLNNYRLHAFTDSNIESKQKSEFSNDIHTREITNKYTEDKCDSNAENVSDLPLDLQIS